MKSTLIGSVAALALVAASGIASAQTSASATVDLNVRAGPGPQHEVIGVINADEQVTVEGCLEGSLWCQVTFSGGSGWAYSDYLTAEYEGAPVVVTERRSELVPVVEYETTASTNGTAAGAATGAIAGAIIGGPIGAAVGGIAGAAAGATLTPEARQYVVSNPVEPVYLEGEVVVGATLPDTVEVREIPNYEYRYVYVNHVPVVVDDNRRIVYVVR